ncbi:MAG: sigma-70 family RNA polymerase sigma factor [Verrucomicrobiales bacterium]|nr:sigma-70 family RNA polymerase sigma factor [Verrucomicrobiales bacterium]
MNEPSDWELLREYSESGAETAFAALTRRYLNLVHSAAFRQVGNHPGAEEVTQVVFILLARKARTLDRRTVLPAWLLRTTRFTAKNFQQSQIRRTRREQEALVMTEPNVGESSWERIAPYLDDAMDQLKEKERSALTLRFFQGKPLKEVGAALGIEPDAAGKRVSRAVEKLKTILVRRGLTLSVTGLIAGLSTHAVQAAPVGLINIVSTGALAKSSAGASSLASSTLKVMGWAKVKASAAIVGTLIAAGSGGTLLALKLLDPTGQKQTPASATRYRLPAGTVKPIVALGRWHGSILAPDGSLWAWGQNTDGWPVLGLTSITNQPTLRRIDTSHKYRALEASEHHNLAVREDGTMWGWGENIHGQVGDGSSGRGNAERDVPVESVPGKNWKSVAAGGSHSLALKEDGTLWAWGNNWAGQLGNARTQREFTEAIQVGQDRDWIAVWAGLLESVAQKADGTLWYWGGNPNPLIPQTGASSSNLFSPVLVSRDTNWVSVGFGAWTILAVKSDGTLWAWGRNAYRYTGEADLSRCAAPHRVGSDTGWKTISRGGWFYQVLMKTDGSLWEIRLDPDSLEPSKGAALPKKLEIPGKIVAFSAGSGQPLGVAINELGEVWTWGKVLGVQTPPNRGMQALSGVARRLGWRTDWGAARPIMQEKPWRLPLEE